MRSLHHVAVAILAVSMLSVIAMLIAEGKIQISARFLSSDASSAIKRMLSVALSFAASLSVAIASAICSTSPPSSGISATARGGGGAADDELAGYGGGLHPSEEGASAAEEGSSMSERISRSTFDAGDIGHGYIPAGTLIRLYS